MTRKSYPSSDEESEPVSRNETRSLETIYKVLSDVELDNPSEPDPWEQLPNESDKAYTAFKTYLFMQPRTYRRVVERLYEIFWGDPEKESNNEEYIFQPKDIGINPGTGRSLVTELELSVQSWSTLYSWKERATKYDLYLDFADDVKKIQQRRSSTHKNLLIADRMLDLVNERLQTLDPKSLGPKVLAEFVKTAVEIQRLSLGLSTQNTFAAKNISVDGKIQIEKQQEEDKIVDLMRQDPVLKEHLEMIADRMLDINNE